MSIAWNTGPLDLGEGGTGAPLFDGDDTITGSESGQGSSPGVNDTLLGFDGNDTIDGRGGNDVIKGGDGIDTLTGGLGADLFSGNLADLAGDRITDLSSIDTIGIGDVELASERFQLTLAGADTLLEIDSDGNGSFETAITLSGAITGAIAATADGQGGTLVTIGVPNIAPVANDDARAVKEYAAAAGNVVVGDASGSIADTDAEDDPLTVTAIDGGTVGQALAGDHGTLILNANGSYTYVANLAQPLAVGTTVQDVFTYTVSDDLLTDDASLTFTVTGVSIGTAAANHFLGNAGANTLSGLGGNDTLDGAAGNETLRGGKGRDILFGRAGADKFDFNSIAESKKGASRDKILDFKRGQDDNIDLRDIDAKTGSGNQKFTFIGKDDFSDTKGELRYKDLGSKVIVQGDTNGDGKADFEIYVAVGSLAKGDFLL